MATLNLTAEQAMARSEECDEIVTIEGSKEAHDMLRDECSDYTEHCVGSHQLMTEYWKNDPDSEDKMTWQVHVLDDPDAHKSEHERAHPEASFPFPSTPQAPRPSKAEGRWLCAMLDWRELFYLKVNSLNSATVRAILTLVRYHANTKSEWQQLSLFKKGKRHGKR